MTQVAPRFNAGLGAGLAAIGLVLTCFFLVAPAPETSTLLRTIFLLLGLLLLPGYVLRGWIWPEMRWPALTGLALAFALSLAQATLVWILIKWRGGGLQTFAVFEAVVLAALGLATGVRTVIRPPSRMAISLEPTAPMLVVIVCGLFWGIVLWRIGALYMPEADGWYYLAIVRRILEAANLTPGDPYFSGIVDPERSGPWLALVALIARQGGLNLVALWNGLPALMMPIALCAFYTLGWVLFNNTWPAALAVALLFAGFAGFTWNEPMMMALPSNVALVISWLAIGLWLTYARGASVRYLIVAVWLVLVVALQHALVYLGVLAIAGSMAVAAGAMSLLQVDPSDPGSGILSPAYWRRLSARTSVFLISCLIVGTPVLLLWTDSMRGTTNPIYSDLWGLFKTLGPWQVLRVSSLSGGPHLYAFSYLALPLLLLYVRRYDWAVYLLGTMTLAAVIAFLPPVVTLLLDQRLLPPWGLWRLVTQIYAFQLTVAILVYEGARLAWPHLKGGFRGQSRLALVLVSIVVVIGFLPNATPLTASAMKYAGLAAQGRPLDDTADWLVTGPFATLPEEARPLILLSDAHTSYYAGSLGPFRVVGIPYGHGSPLVPDDSERRAAIALLERTDGNLAELRQVLSRYAVDAVLLVEDPGDGSLGLPSAAWAHWSELLDSADDEFDPIYRDNSDQHRTATYLWRNAGAAQ